MKYMNNLKSCRDYWRKQNKEVLNNSNLEYIWKDKDTILCHNYIHNLRTGLWHKHKDGKKIYGQSTRFFIKFLQSKGIINGSIKRTHEMDI